MNDLERRVAEAILTSRGTSEAYWPTVLVEARAAIAECFRWLPIETAPKDGREYLLQVKMRAGIRGKMLVGHYMPGGFCIGDHPAINEGWYFWNGRMFDKAAEPIRYMLLPPPPEDRP